MASVDNDIVRVFFNGTSIAEDIRHGECPIPDEFRIDVPLNLVQPGQNLVAFQLLDRPPPLGPANESFFDARILAEFPMTIKIPIRWCGVEGSPSMIDPSVVGADSTDEVLLQRLMLVNRSIYMGQTNMMPQTNMALRSGISLAHSTRRFPIIPDPNPPPMGAGMPGDVSVGPPGCTVSTCDETEVQQVIDNCKMRWQREDPTVTGITVVHINRFVFNDGTLEAVLGRAFVPLRSNGLSQATKGAVVIDNAYTLPTSTMRREPRFASEERFDKTLGHELGHKLSLVHGNGVDDNNDGVIDGDDPETFAGPNLMEFQRDGIMITPAQSNQMRSQALMHIPDRMVDSVPAPLVKTSVDGLGDVPAGEAFVDIEEFGVEIDQEVGKTIFASSTGGLLLENISNVRYFFFADVDNDPTTGGSPTDIGIPASVQGIEVIGQVQVGMASGSSQATPTVLVFQDRQFVAVTDPSIQARVLTESIPLHQPPTEAPISQSIELELSSDLVPSMSMDIVLAAMAENPNTGTRDNAEAKLTFNLPTFPSCQVTPMTAALGDKVTVAASDLPPGATALVFLDPDFVARGRIDDLGNTTIPFIIPRDAADGQLPVTVVIKKTALTANCSVIIAEAE